MHADSHCTTECCHGMRSTSFLLPAVGSFMPSTNWCHSSCLPPWYTFDFMKTHRRNLMGSNRVTWWAKSPVYFFLSIFFHNFPSEFSWPLCRDGGFLPSLFQPLQNKHNSIYCAKTEIMFIYTHEGMMMPKIVFFHVAATFVLVLQEAYYLNTEATDVSEHSRIRGC